MHHRGLAFELALRRDRGDRMKVYPFALLALAACSSGSTIEVSAGGVGGSGEGGGDAGVELDAADEAATCGGSAAGEPCAVDSDCKPASACEHPRCDELTKLCIVTDGLPDGDPCEEGGACASRRCCR